MIQLTMKSITLILKQSACIIYRVRLMAHDEGLRYQVQFDEGFDNTLVVDGVPVIDKSKLEKLLAKIAREFSRKGAPIKTEDIFVPWDDVTDKSKGYVHSRFYNFVTVPIVL